jgi:hypothetical protein
MTLRQQLLLLLRLPSLHVQPQVLVLVTAAPTYDTTNASTLHWSINNFFFCREEVAMQQHLQLLVHQLVLLVD